ncbi:MAG: aromatic acid exporter family protein [Candidatus Galacturonibacter soehngenii]|nr:aromatic acid exporter family protein [Candidatus Galacturonibacter soehngenii]
MKIIKIAFGTALAIILANFFSLAYSPSAGIITLLTIQDTTKETITISFKRLLAFCIATVLSFGIFQMLGFTPVSFGVFLLFFVWICYHFKLQDAIAMNAVLTTHFLIEQNMSFSLIGNELFLLIIGAGIGTLLNLYMPSKIKQIRDTQATLEADIRSILSHISDQIKNASKMDVTPECFTSLDAHIQTGIKHAYTNMNNTFSQENQYFLSYMQMRKQQYQVLKNIYDKILSLEHIPSQANDIANFINHIALSLNETNNANSLLMECNSLFEMFQSSELPVSRQEFESRAVLYMILKDFEYFLRIKQDFAMSLTEEQKIKFWNQSEGGKAIEK